MDPSGKGLLEVWKRQIQQFNRVSLEMAEAIVSAYPSPQLLIQVRMPQESPALRAASQLTWSSRNHLIGINFDMTIPSELFSKVVKEPVPQHPLLWLYQADCSTE